MKKIKLLFLLILPNLFFSQESNKFQYSIYTIDSLFNSENVKLVSNEKISFNTKDNRTRLHKIINNKSVSFSNNTNLENKMIFILDSLKKTANINNDEISFFSFYDNNNLNFFESYFYLFKKNIFVTLNNKSIIGLDNLIKFKYGSLKKYSELRMERFQFEKIMSQPLDTLKTLIKDDYVVSQDVFPNDTVRAVNLLIDEVNLVVNLNDYEKKIFKEKINLIIKSKNFKEDYPYLNTIIIFKRNINSVFSEILDKERFFKCIMHFDFYRKVRVGIINKIFSDFKKSNNKENYNEYLKQIISK